MLHNDRLFTSQLGVSKVLFFWKFVINSVGFLNHIPQGLQFVKDILSSLIFLSSPNSVEIAPRVNVCYISLAPRGEQAYQAFPAL